MPTFFFNLCSPDSVDRDEEGVEFPDIEAVQRYTAAMEQLTMFQYSEGISALGTLFEMPSG